MDFEHKEGVKPVCSRTYSIPKSTDIMLKKEIKWLEKIGALKRTNKSEWVVPSFAQPNKTGTV